MQHSERQARLLLEACERFLSILEPELMPDKPGRPVKAMHAGLLAALRLELQRPNPGQGPRGG